MSAHFDCSFSDNDSWLTVDTSLIVGISVSLSVVSITGNLGIINHILGKRELIVSLPTSNKFLRKCYLCAI